MPEKIPAGRPLRLRSKILQVERRGKGKRESFFAKTASINQVQNKVHTESVKKNNFSNLKTEFQEAFYSQREFWKSKKIIEIPDDFFGYHV